ncbi:MAG: bifunctional nicotinamidase/pyrazinamidase [Verrucomicrobiales bacterium]
MPHKALILVDIQNDFLPGGPMAVPGAQDILPLANQLISQHPHTLATQDWHPADHGSFTSNHPGCQNYQQIDLHGLPQTLWPDHCIQNTGGALFPPGLHTHKITRVFPKGTQNHIDSYSGFHDNGKRQSTGLADYLRAHHITHLTICGLATDYCVKHTALDAIAEGFQTQLHLPACRGVGLQAGDIDQALQDLVTQGVEIRS